MTNKTSLGLAALVAAGAISACGDDSTSNGSNTSETSATAPTTIVTIIVEGSAGPPGPPGPPGPAGRDGVPAPQTPAPTGTGVTPAPTPTAAPTGSGGGGAGGAEGDPASDVTVLLGYDTDVPGSEADNNTVFLDAEMLPLAVMPGVASEGATTYAEFIIPFDGTGPQQWGWNAELPGAPLDLRGMELVIRLRWVSGFNPDDVWGGLQLYAWSNDWTADITNDWTSLDPATRGMWVEYTLDLSKADAPDADPMFDPGAVLAVGYTFNTGGDETTFPAATEATFQVDYVGVRPLPGAGGAGGADAGGGGAGGGGAGGGGAGGMDAGAPVTADAGPSGGAPDAAP